MYDKDLNTIRLQVYCMLLCVIIHLKSTIMFFTKQFGVAWGNRFFKMISFTNLSTVRIIES